MSAWGRICTAATALFAAACLAAQPSLAEEKTGALPPAAPAFTQTGMASFYTSHGKTASGAKSDPRALTAAHRKLPFGTKVRVTHLKSGKEVTVVITDRGPFRGGRIIDVSREAAKALDMVKTGTARVRITRLD